MRVMVTVNVEQYSTADLIAYATWKGCPVNLPSQPERTIKWLITQYGQSLLNRMADFMNDRNADRVLEAMAAEPYTGPRTYQITTVHPTGYKDGNHTVKVYRCPIVDNAPESRYVDGADFGCSRDYVTPSDTVAISNLLAEHGMRMAQMTRIS